MNSIRSKQKSLQSIWVRHSSFNFSQSKIWFVANLWCKSKLQIFRIRRLRNRFEFDTRISISVNQIVDSSQFSYRHIVIMISTYEKRLIIFKKWFYITSTSESLIVAEFCFESNIKNFTTCSKCNLTLSNWKFKRNSMKIHIRQSSNCVFAQELNIISKKTSIAISIIVLVDSTSTKFISINCIAFSPQILYLIIENLYHKQKTLFVKNEKLESSSLFIQSKLQLVASSEYQIKLKFFKFDEFTINFNSNSTSMILCFESIIKSNVVLVASSIFISISKNSNSISLRSISLCSTSTILLINQSSYLLVANQYQHIVMTFFFSYDKRLTTFTKWSHTSFTSKALIQAEFRYTFTKLSLNCITCRRCDLIFEDWKSHDDFIKEHFQRSFECSKAKTVVVAVKKTAEAAKSDACFRNINFFDFTMQINLWKKFRISVFSASFLQHLIEIIVNYREKSVIKILFQCLRDSVLQWLKNQHKFISLNDFKIIMTKIFLELVVNFDSVIIDFSPQKYHRCLECDVQFSSISRFLIHAQKNCNKIYTCKHCEKIFTSNNKFHEHVRLHYIKKNYNNKTLKQRFVEERSNHIDLLNSFTSSTTFKSMTTSAESSYLFIFMTKAQIARSIVFSIDFSSTNSTAFKLSRRHESTCMFSTASSNSFQTSVLLHSTSFQKITIVRSKSHYFSIFSIIFRSTSAILKSSRHSITMMNASVVCFSTFRRNLNAIRKRMRFSLFSMSDQIQITNYFKSVDQSNSTSIKSIKFSLFISCFCSTSRLCSSVNRITETSQHQHIAIDETSSLKIKQKLKFDVFINNSNSTSRVCSSINQNARISHIASEVNFTSLITSTKTSNLETQQRIKIRASVDSSKSRYLVAADVDHTNKNIRVETSLTNAREYNSIKSSIKSTEKFKSIKFNIFISCLNSTSRFCSSVNHDSIMSFQIDFFRALINQQVVYVSIAQFSYRFSYQLASLSLQTTIHRCRRRSHKHINIRVETTLKKKREIMWRACTE